MKSLAMLKKLLPQPQQPGIDLTANQADETPQLAAANTGPDNKIRLVG